MISVIVPVYNADLYLQKCLESIILQTYKDIEIILVDDCSSDNSLSICEIYRKKDHRIKLLRNKRNQGQVYSYCRGIKEAKGDFIAFVDSDDWVDPDMLNQLYQAMKTYKADIAICGCWQIYEEKRFVEPSDIDEIGIKEYSHNDVVLNSKNIHTLHNEIEHTMKLYRCNKLFKKEIIINNLKYIQNDIRVFEDNNLVIPCLLDANKIVYINHPLYYYRRSHASTMSLFNEKILNSMNMFLENQKNIFKSKNIAHEMDSDAYMACAYTINGILKSKETWSVKRRYLNEVAAWIYRYKVKIQDLHHYGASKQFAFIFKMIHKRHFTISIVMGSLYNRLKNILGK